MCLEFKNIHPEASHRSDAMRCDASSTAWRPDESQERIPTGASLTGCAVGLAYRLLRPSVEDFERGKYSTLFNSLA